MALSKFGHPEKKDGKQCQLLQAFYPLWIFGCRTVCEEDTGLQIQRVGQIKAQCFVPLLYTSHSTALWVSAPFCDNVKPTTPLGAVAEERPLPAAATLFRIEIWGYSWNSCLLF